MTEEQYLTSIMPSRDEIDAFVERGVGATRPSRNGGVAYDAELGWIRVEAVRPEGVEGSKAYYTYEPDHARKGVNFGDRACRVHTFGDSFTHCDEVSDGETWQEYLAAHLQEPVRNYGCGGFSVYQAYLRMKRVDASRSVPYIVINVYDHDHWRNLFDWWAINFGQRVECGFTCPHVRVNVEQDRIEERPNRLRTREDVYKLCDRDWVIDMFRDDPVLPVALARRFPEWLTAETVERVARGFGIPASRVAGLPPLEAIGKLVVEASTYATRRVIMMFDEYARATGKQLCVILSHCDLYTADYLAGKPRWDQTFLDFLNHGGYRVIDLRNAFAANFKELGAADPMTYLRKYYNGHATPAGNFFTAWAIKDAFVRWLEPPPLPYARSNGGVNEGVRVQASFSKPRADVRGR